VSRAAQQREETLRAEANSRISAAEARAGEIARQRHDAIEAHKRYKEQEAHHHTVSEIYTQKRRCGVAAAHRQVCLG